MSEEKTSQYKELFEVGAHFGYSKTRRHPSTKPYIFGVKNQLEIIDLERTEEMLNSALEFVKKLASEGKKILFVGNKPDIREVVKSGAEKANLPYVAERWIGGTLTNFDQIKKRTGRLQQLKDEKAKGGLDKYTKKEQNVLAKEMADLERFFAGILGMERIPAALFVVDSKAEDIAVVEAKKVGIPVISISNSDCDIQAVDFPILANDNTQKSVSYFVGRVVDAYLSGTKSK